MKKFFTFLTGIVFLVAILVTCGGRNSINQKDPKHVKIYLKALELDGEMHLLISDSNNPGDTVLDNLITEVQREGSVLWKKDAHTIKNILQIRSVKNEVFMFKKTAELNEDNDSIQIVIPPDVNHGTVKYIIVFTDKNDNIWSIDPYLKIPPPQ